MNEKQRNVLIFKMPTMNALIKGGIIGSTFILSCFNSTMLTIWTIIMPVVLLFLHKRVGAIEAFILVQMRSILNPGFIIAYSGIASISKWGAIFLISFYLLLYKKWENKKIMNVGIWILLFSIIAIISAFFNSSYPVVATFKIISYAVPCVAIFKGVSETVQINWMRKIVKLLGVLLFLSIILIRNPLGYFRNGSGFQGFFSHPNVYGVMLAIFLAGYLYMCKKASMLNLLVVILTISLAVLSASRTGMMSVVILVLIYMLSFNMRVLYKVILVIIISITICLLLFLGDSVSEAFSEILFKGHEGNLLFSRSSQIQKNVTRFISHPLIGTGFNVPYDKGIHSLAFSFDLIVENGNLILALLGDVGIIGSLIFVVSYFKIYKLGKNVIATIFFVPFLVSMGEMSFFSTNNFAIIFYLYFAIFMIDGMKYNSNL